MRQVQTTPRHALLATLIGTLLTVGACSTQNSSKPATPAQQARNANQATEPGTDVSAYRDAYPDSDYSAIFNTAEQQLGTFNWVGAKTTLLTIPPGLNADDAARRDYLLAGVAWLRGDSDSAKRLLADNSHIAPSLAVRRVNFLRHIEGLQRDYLSSAQLGSKLLSEHPDYPAANSLSNSIWRDLEHLSPAALNTAVVTDDPDWAGWQQLARIHVGTDDLDALRSALRNWQAEHPNHPAAKELPGGLAILLAEPSVPRKTVLLLPLSGPLAPAAAAVRDGFLAAWYAAEDTQYGGNEVTLIDTNAFPDAVSAYQEAIQQGASIVVGPLSKERVSELGQHPDRPVPVLALNRVDEALPTGPTALVQLALAPEDEVKSLSRLAFGQGARRVLVLRPAGAWGDKMFNLLQQNWQALGGQLVSTATYSKPDSYSNTIAELFDLGASAERANKLRSMLATDIEYTTRRRSDFDALFLLASNPAEARALKPLLAFHYAGNVPVYATSSIYPGIPNPQDQDLNGIRLTELPWLLGSDPGLRVAIAAGNTGTDSYTRLNALGADAFLIQRRFSQLGAGPYALFRGDTGLLSMDPQLRLERETRPATFDRGTLKSM